MAENQGKSFKIDFYQHIFSYLNQAIVLADSKVGILLVVCTAILGYMFHAYAYSVYTPASFKPFCFFFAVLCVFGAVLLCLKALSHRSKPSSGEGLIFFEDVVKRSKDQYVHCLRDILTPEKIENEYEEELYCLSRVADGKYQDINSGLLLLVLGLVFGGLYLFL